MTESEMIEKLWVAAAALAGSIVSLAFDAQQTLALKGKIFTIFVGFTFAVFVGPVIVRAVFGPQPADSQLVGALYFFMSASSMTLLPMLLKTFSNRISSTVGGMIKPSHVGKEAE